MSIVLRIVHGCWYYFWGHIFGALFYDKKYFQGRWFSGKMNGLCAVGWKWVTHDAISRLLGTSHSNKAPYPVDRRCTVIHPENVFFHPNDLNNFHTMGVYYQGIGQIRIGEGSYIGPNVGLITSNHDVQDLERHAPAEDIILGKKCWIGMNSVILPGVILGERTVVGAGSVVTKSFPKGNCVIAGNPAKVIREINGNV